MNLVKFIKSIIFKIKDYDRLERDYCIVLDRVTGGMLSKPNYNIDSIFNAINEYFKEQN